MVQFFILQIILQKLVSHYSYFKRIKIIKKYINSSIKICIIHILNIFSITYGNTIDHKFKHTDLTHGISSVFSTSHRKPVC